ncbi:MAG: hypothetical protein HFE90_02560 [Firmicutes bacterium]|nr:hypothetical protein [Bacillota bacterium]
MRARVKALSVLLTLCMLCSLLYTPVASAATEQTDGSVTGSISATIRIDYEQTLDEIKERMVKAEILKGGTSIGSINLWEDFSSGYLKKDTKEYPFEVKVRSNDNNPEYLDFTVKNLPTGKYTVKFTGKGYVSYSENITLSDYSQHLIIGTGDKTFTLGDVNEDNKVNKEDVEAISAVLEDPEKKLNGEDAELIKVYDLNGDNKIDVKDLSYINNQLAADGGASVINTAMLNPSVDIEDSRQEMHSGGTVIKSSGGDNESEDLKDLFKDNGRYLTFSANEKTISEENPVILPVILNSATEMEEIQISSPVLSAPQSGKVTVIDENNDSHTFEFNRPDGVFAVGKSEGSNVITINLGKRVAVKKIIITVTKTAEDKYVTVENIQFLKDIVPENPVQPNSEIKNLTAKAGNEQVSLSWQEIPNVSGYKIDYYPQGKETESKSMKVSVKNANVTGLENLKKYVFTVTPTDGNWEGKPSKPVVAMPEPSSAPKAPDMITIGEMDGALSVSWKNSENATFYEVYYKEKEAAESEWKKLEGTFDTTSTTVKDLTNGTTYSVYVISGNLIGKSAPSRIYEGTPKATNYDEPEGIPTAGRLDKSKIEKIELGDPNNYNKADYPNGFNVNNIIDGDYKTHWTVKNWSGNEHVICTFKEPVSLYSAIWAPRLDGSYPSNLRAYSVRVWYDKCTETGCESGCKGHLLVPNPESGGVDNGGGSSGSDVWTWPNIPNFSSIATSRFAILPFGPVENINKISVAVEQRGYNIVSLSELIFLEYDKKKCLPDEITALFADGLHTKLASGVNQAKIDELRARLNSDEKNYYLYTDALEDELKLAEELLAGSSKGVIINGIESRSASADSQYKQGGSDLQPLGVAASANSRITVYAEGIPEGASIAVKATQFNAEASAWQAQAGTITNGRNIIDIPKIGSQNTARGGSLYITYSGADADKIRLHVRRAVDIPVLNVATGINGTKMMSDADRDKAINDYLTELKAFNQSTECLNVTEIATPSVLLSLPAASVKNSTAETLKNSILAWEDIMHICKTTQGINNTYANNDMQSRQNIRCMQMFAGAFMYAAGNHIGIGTGSCAGMVSGKPIAALGNNAQANNLFGWGIAHEIGHNMDKLGKAEITNNIYSIMVQTYDGKQNTLPSRLEKSNKYDAIFNKVAQAYPGASNDVFVQLGMYWQLHLAYDDGTEPLKFYNEFFKAWKAGTHFNGATSYDDKVALTASAVAGKNLTEFFERWGMTLSDATKTKLATYAAESRAVWYLNDQSRRNRLNKTGSASGTVSVTADKSGDKDIVLTIDNSGITGDIQGYEIRRNGKSIAFTKETTYTDTIGSANNRTYQYEVVAYDTLGNKIADAGSGELRISYDKVIDSNQYAFNIENGTATFTLNNETAISGIKFTGQNFNNGGDFTVEITSAEANAQPVTAKSSQFTDADNLASDKSNSFVTYFNKPGTSSTDTRIWTYDAKTVKVTGVPAGATVQLISYAGDDVAFLEKGSVGRLASDYSYTDADNKTQTIPKGTLIITGTYRGNPVFNTIKIRGKFATNSNGDADVETKIEERDIDGYTLMFAEIPADGEVSDISDGIFIFVPNVQNEAELQGVSSCDSVNLLPAQIKAIMEITDDPNSAASKRTSAETLWINSPGASNSLKFDEEGGASSGDGLPEIKLEGNQP